MKNSIWAAAIVPAAFLAQPVSAAPLLYTITGSYQASFMLEDHPTTGVLASDPQFFFLDPSDPNVFYIANVAGTFGGYHVEGGLTFYNDAEGGGLTITITNPDTHNFDTISPVGLQLFSGAVTSPTLLAFGPTTFDDFDAPGAKSYTISAVAVPEPASWLMLVAGFGMVGAAMRSRRTVRFSFA